MHLKLILGNDDWYMIMDSENNGTCVLYYQPPKDDLYPYHYFDSFQSISSPNSGVFDSN